MPIIVADMPYERTKNRTKFQIGENLIEIKCIAMQTWGEMVEFVLRMANS